MNDGIRDRMDQTLKGRNARYKEVPLEETDSTYWRYGEPDLESVGHSTGIGGCVRALTHGWDFTFFNDLEDLREKAEVAVHNARSVGEDPINTAPIEPVVESVPLVRRHLPRLPAKWR